ncbi:YceI family protein [Dyella sp. BiH032]|uniref:YceI family protein n=1 Tax=Dyella sp. BiH032 TaxID=3075430 RepID=UPI00289379B9|nr:YceI family protein [Dyella sp. BiH032]WNL46166.1 YceI family protein [Dyella sp. BiH032]
MNRRRRRWLAQRVAAPLVLALASPSALHAADYRIDPARSHAEFGVRLFWLSQVTGSFERIEGEVTLSARRDVAVVDAHIAVDSIRMGSERFRRWVMAPEFFDAEHYPTIHFVSEPVPVASLENGGELYGRLTLRGVSRPAHFELLPSPCPLDSPRECRIEVRGDIQRSDFGMTGHRTALSDQVRLGLVIAIDRAAP